MEPTKVEVQCNAIGGRDIISIAYPDNKENTVFYTSGYFGPSVVQKMFPGVEIKIKL